MSQDYYQVLGVSRGASKEEIRKAFKKIARENHPDAKPDDHAAAERFKQAAEAYDVLGDEEKRKKYDKFGANWKHVQEGGPFPGGDPFRQGGPVDIDLRDLFGGKGAVDLGELFGGMFGGRRGAQQPQQRRGQDLKHAITIPFQMAATGGEYELTVGNQRLTVRIPAGIEHGKSIRLAGQGQPGARGGPAGDLLVAVHVSPHPYFWREKDNVLVEVPVSMTEAALGAKIDVPTLVDGMVSMTLPPGTSSGAKLRLKQKGFPNPRTKAQGDQLVVIKVTVPKELDSHTREMLEELDRTLDQQPRTGLW